MATRTKATATANTLPCALCNQALERRLDKRQKPYFICDECGTQFCIRYRSGIAKLEALMQSPRRRDAVALPALTASAVRAELDLIDEAMEHWDEIEDDILAPGSDDPRTALPLPEWMQQRTARVRSILKIK